MDLTVGVVYLLAFGAIGAANFIHGRRRAMVDPWEAAARAVGLSAVQVALGLAGARLRGRKGPFTVELSRRVAYRETTTTAVVIGGLPRPLTLKLESAGASSGGGGGSRDVELGDPAFDSEVYLHGSPALIHALMDAATRARVRSMLRNNAVTVQNGELRATVHDEFAHGPGSRITVVLPLLLEFAEVLAPPADVVARLVANAKDDPAAGVRAANLLTLVREYPDHPAARPALSAALADGDDAVRLCAATLLSPEGTPVLLEIAGGPNTDDSCAGRAIGALGRHLPPERVPAILSHALRSRRIRTASACLAWLGRFRPPGAAETLAKVLVRENGTLAEAAAQALGTCGQPEAESALIGALEHESAPARTAAAEALGTSGSVAAVEPLRRAETDHPDAAFRRAARQAIAAIQARAGSATPGQLTLAEGESGRLSLGGDEAGHVSLTPTSGDGPTDTRE